MKSVVVTEFSTDWASRFEALKDELWPLVSDIATAIEHVGSTAVEGLAAKPVIDLDIIIESESRLAEIRGRLDEAGYEFLGERGITGRYAFRCRRPQFAHNLYVCIDGCLALRNHLLLRDHLRTHTEDRRRYGEVKRLLADRHPDDIDAYTRGKTEFIAELLTKCDLHREELAEIERQN